MESLYFWCAVVGGTILVLQTLLLVLGGGDADADATDGGHDLAAHDDAANAFFKVLSLKAIVAFLTFFGLAGLGAGHAGVSRVPTLLVALAAGGAAFYMVVWLMEGLSRLQAHGNIDLDNALGSVGRVYLRVPARRAGRGKVTITVQGRTLECKALTAGNELETGATVRVVAVPEPNVVEVAAVEPSGDQED
jgi:hypothetical protein